MDEGTPSVQNETIIVPPVEQNIISTGGASENEIAATQAKKKLFELSQEREEKRARRLEKLAWESSVMKKFLSHPLFYIATVICCLSILQVSGTALWLDEPTFESITFTFYGAALFFFGLAYVLALGATFKNVMLHMVQLGGGLGFIHMAFSVLRHFEAWKIVGIFASTAIFALIGAGFGLFWSVFLLLRHRPHFSEKIN